MTDPKKNYLALQDSNDATKKYSVFNGKFLLNQKVQLKYKLNLYLMLILLNYNNQIN